MKANEDHESTDFIQSHRGDSASYHYAFCKGKQVDKAAKLKSRDYLDGYFIVIRDHPDRACFAFYVRPKEGLLIDKLSRYP